MGQRAKVFTWIAVAVLSVPCVFAGGTLTGGKIVEYEMGDDGSSLAAKFAVPWDEPGTSCDSEFGATSGTGSVTVFFDEGWDNGQCDGVVAKFTFEVSTDGGVIESGGSFTITCSCTVQSITCTFTFETDPPESLPTNGAPTTFDDGDDLITITVAQSTSGIPGAPTLGEWGMIAAMVGLAFVGILLILRRRVETAGPA